MLKIYNSTGEVAAMELSPVRALALAQELTAPAVTAIKIAQWGDSWPG